MRLESNVAPRILTVSENWITESSNLTEEFCDRMAAARLSMLRLTYLLTNLITYLLTYLLTYSALQ